MEEVVAIVQQKAQQSLKVVTANALCENKRDAAYEMWRRKRCLWQGHEESKLATQITNTIELNCRVRHTRRMDLEAEVREESCEGERIGDD
jgi:hypothetical protein